MRLKNELIINAFKLSYKEMRKYSSEIYRGFGFKHLSDATFYYVHPNNQSYNGTTTLCQSIGEAIILFAAMIQEMEKEILMGDYYFEDGSNAVFMEIDIPSDYRVNDVVENNLIKYRIYVADKSIQIAAYNQADEFLSSNINDLKHYYKLLPLFLVLLAREMEADFDFRDRMIEFAQAPAVDVFVNLHEDFYQNHKFDEYKVKYDDLKGFDKSKLISFSDIYKTILENKKERKPEFTVNAQTFERGGFPEEYLEYIPRLTEEFELPEHLHTLCNAICSGDIVATLFHGPAGTGKTMACKLIAREIDLPILETINCTENLDEFVLGKYIPYEDRIIFKESYVTKAIRDGGGVVFEEINFAKPQYLAFLNSLLDDNGFVRLDNGEIVKRHANFRFFATMNIGYFGTKQLNQSLYNRFNAVLEISELSDGAIKKMLIARVPECQEHIEKILGLYHKIKRKVEAEELDVVISPRNLENWVRLAKYEGYIKAAEKTVIPIAKCDRILEESIRGILRLYKWQ